ncbi:MAG TPA: YfhO family protein, partial [Aggregatilineaceae bacterium]|nr:YfhO family protein [Aggregatilineaceae bacterium]
GWQSENPYSAPDPVALAWLVPQTHWHGSDETIKEALLDPAWNPVQTVILAGEPAAESDARDMTNGKVVMLESDPTTQHYRVTSDGAAYLVIAQTWYPGWTATLNGKQVPLYRANLAFQAVAVPPGETDVTLAYHLNHWRWGVGTTTLGLLAAVGLMLSGNVRRVRHVHR